MADWKANLRRASFRAIPFYTETHGGDSGRRWADHEYPGRDVPYAEDMGRSQRIWRFTGYLIGDDYPMRRNALVAACEAAGPGELVHPTIGTVQAVCRSLSHTEARDRGRYVALQFEFAEAGKLREPAGWVDAATMVANAAQALGSTLGTGFKRSFNTSGGGAYLTNSAAARTMQLAATLQQIRLPAPGVDQGALNQALRTLATEAPRLVIDPAALSTAIDLAFAEYTNAGEAMPVTSSMLSFTAPGMVTRWHPSQISPVYYSTRSMMGGGATYRLPVVEQRRVNIMSFETYTRGLALREVGYAIPGVPLDNYDQAMELLDTVAQEFIALEAASAAVGDDDTYQALATLRAEITRMIRSRAVNLTPLVRYRVTGETAANSLAFAWRMYQDSGRDLEVVDRTNARSPAYMPFTGRVLSQ